MDGAADSAPRGELFVRGVHDCVYGKRGDVDDAGGELQAGSGYRNRVDGVVDLDDHVGLNESAL
jgi:hypothetical protein